MANETKPSEKARRETRSWLDSHDLYHGDDEAEVLDSLALALDRFAAEREEAVIRAANARDRFLYWLADATPEDVAQSHDAIVSAIKARIVGDA